MINNFNCNKKEVADFRLNKNSKSKKIVVIEALDGQLITNKLNVIPKIENDFYVSNIDNDSLKIALINRYKDAPVAIGFVKNFGLKRGAIASSVAHDSHNIIAVGADDESFAGQLI